MQQRVLYLIRHGPPQYPVDADGKRRIYGPAAGLTEAGRLKCTALAQAILHHDGAPLTLLVSSPYVRAAQTAALLAQAFGTARLISDERLRDTASTWEGTPVEEFMAIFEQGRTFDDPRTCESIEAIGQRMLAAYAACISQFPDERIGIVSHGDPLRALYYRLRHPQGAFPPYPELVRLLSLDAAQGLRLVRTSSNSFEGNAVIVSAASDAPYSA